MVEDVGFRGCEQELSMSNVLVIYNDISIEGV